MERFTNQVEDIRVRLRTKFDHEWLNELNDTLNLLDELEKRVQAIELRLERQDDYEQEQREMKP